MQLNTRHNLVSAGIVWFGVLLFANIAEDRSDVSSMAGLHQSYEWLQSHPLDTAALDHLATLVDTPDDHTAARQFLNLAALHSLRDVRAQAHLIDDLVSAKNYKSALVRIDAVLRQQKVDAQVFFRLIMALVHDEKSLSELTDLLATNPPWRVDFVNFAARDTLNSDTLYKIFANLHARQFQVSENELQTYLKALVKHQDIERANFVWLDFLNSSSLNKVGLLYDGGFSQSPRNQFFDWTLSPPSDVSIGLAARSGLANNYALALDFVEAKPSQILVSQYLLLTAGHFALRGEVNAALLQGENDLRWEVRCIEKTSALGVANDLGKASQWTSFNMTFTIPAEDCAYQKLVLYSRGTGATVLNGQIYFDNFSINQASSNDG